ncbi:MAG: hypothetical protein LBQ15_06200 [Clostridium sp.]|jgi:O-antigen/teichoic acid export membrane protein|nr:hypothetical protein [Clostridium sp.]
MNRSRKATKNIMISLAGYLAVLLAGFVSRIVFIRYMGIEMVGVGQLFANLLTMLSYAQLGAGTAIIYGLYDCVSAGDTIRVQSLLRFYRSCFHWIGTGILVFVLAALPLLRYVIVEEGEIPYAHAAFAVLGINAAVSYFWASKRCIIIAAQDKWLSSLYSDAASVIQLCVQVAVIVLTQNYLFYLLVNTACILASNLAVSAEADRRYPFLKERGVPRIGSEEKKRIIKTTAAMLGQKMGFIVAFAIDSLLIVRYLGLHTMGLYANYLMVLNALKLAINILFQSVVAGMGNVAVTESRERLREIFDVLDLLGFWIHGFAAVCLLVLFNPFIILWLGGEYTFSAGIVLVLVVNFYLDGRRKAVITCKDVLGLQWNDRYKPVLECGLNLALCLALIRFLGLGGVLLGMAGSVALTSGWIEPWILHRHGFGKPSGPYFVKRLKQVLVLCLAGGLAWVFAALCGSGEGTAVFLVRMLICTVVPNAVFWLAYGRSKEFREGIVSFQNIMKISRGDEET